MTTFPSSFAAKPANAVAKTAFSWLDWVLAAFAGAITLRLYFGLIIPGLLVGDGGEFQTLTYLLGHTHPTGYPVYLTLSRLFAVLPTGNPAYRVNLFSAVMAAITVASVYLLGRQLTKQRLVPLLASICLALAPTFWSQSLIAEVYTTGSALFVLILIALVAWYQQQKSRYLLLAGVLGGLSVGVHMSVALLAPAVALFIIATTTKQRARADIGAAVGGALIGVALTTALFMLMDNLNPTASYFTSVIEPSRSAWGLTATQIDGGFERMLWGWRARQFQTFMWGTTEAASHFAWYQENLWLEFGRFPLALAPVGALALCIKRWRIALLLLVGLACQLLFFFNYAIWDIYVFFIPSYVLIALLIAVGAGALVDCVVWAGQQVNKQADENRVVKLGLDLLAVAIMLFLMRPQLATAWQAYSEVERPFQFDEFPDYSESTEAFTFAVTVNLDQDAILFTGWDMLYPYYYSAYLQHERDDLLFIETQPADDQGEIAESVIPFIAAHIENRPIYFSDRIDAVVAAGYDFSPARIGPLRAYKVYIP